MHRSFVPPEWIRGEAVKINLFIGPEGGFSEGLVASAILYEAGELGE